MSESDLRYRYDCSEERPPSLFFSFRFFSLLTRDAGVLFSRNEDEFPKPFDTPEHFSINLVIVNEVVKEQEEQIVSDVSPPSVPKRLPLPPQLPRSSSTSSVSSSRDYPVSPPPRRRYLSPERRRRALQIKQNEGNGSRPPSLIEDQETGVFSREFLYRREASSPTSVRGPFQVQNDLRDTEDKDVLATTAPQDKGSVTASFREKGFSVVPPRDQEASDESDRKVRNGAAIPCEDDRSDLEGPSNGDNLRMTVTIRTVPETGSFRRKSESRNSIHVDFNVRDGLSWTGRAAGGEIQSTAGVAPVAGLSRSRSLRGHRNTQQGTESTGEGAAKNAWEDFSPPPLPPRKAREDVKRPVQTSSSPTAKRVTFQIIQEPPVQDPSAHVLDANTAPEDSFFTKPQRPAPRASEAKDVLPEPVRNGSRSPSHRTCNGTNGDTSKDKVAEDVHKMNGHIDKDQRPRALSSSPSSSCVVIKTFEPPSSVSDVSTDCYNVYNVRTRKISSSVTKPNGLGKARTPLVTVQAANGNTSPVRREGQLSKLRNMSPTREAEKLIGKIISRCKSSSALGGKERKSAAAEPRQQQSQTPSPQLLKLTARQQQRHSRCTKCALAQSK